MLRLKLLVELANYLGLFAPKMSVSHTSSKLLKWSVGIAAKLGKENFKKKFLFYGSFREDYEY